MLATTTVTEMKSLSFFGRLASRELLLGDAALPRGSGLWHTWFDKDLSVADRVLLGRKDGQLVHELVR